jgi:hypothetical protein
VDTYATALPTVLGRVLVKGQVAVHQSLGLQITGCASRQLLNQQHSAPVVVEELAEAQDLPAILEDFASEVSNI